MRVAVRPATSAGSRSVWRRNAVHTVRVGGTIGRPSVQDRSRKWSWISSSEPRNTTSRRDWPSCSGGCLVCPISGRIVDERLDHGRGHDLGYFSVELLGGIRQRDTRVADDGHVRDSHHAAVACPSFEVGGTHRHARTPAFSIMADARITAGMQLPQAPTATTATSTPAAWSLPGSSSTTRSNRVRGYRQSSRSQRSVHRKTARR